jgi:hypothetical protein
MARKPPARTSNEKAEAGPAHRDAGILNEQVMKEVVNADPITGNLVNASGAGISGLTVNIVNSKNATVATAATDVTSFYYFPEIGSTSTAVTELVEPLTRSEMRLGSAMGGVQSALGNSAQTGVDRRSAG